MKAISIKDIVNAVSGELAWGDDGVLVNDVIIDSRQAKEGSLFVPIVGEKVDAHKFIKDVLDNNASLVFSSDHTIKYDKGACIYVEDTLKALQDLAKWYRSQFTLPIIGITGSVGKTTTKEMIACVLEKKYKTLKTLKNLNSQIGVALMMFKIEEDTEVAVIEMGISEFGEMDRLVEIVRPRDAVLTGIGVSHIANLKTRENICNQKGRIVKYIEDPGIFYVCGNGDAKELTKEKVPYELNKNAFQTRFYGTEEGCMYYADAIETVDDIQRFVFHGVQDEGQIDLNVIGEHNVCDAVVALAIGEQYKVSLEDARGALAEYKHIQMRGQVKDINGAHIIDDTYNASPDSINSNIHALFTRNGGKKIAVLADVLELGTQSKRLHEGIAQYIATEKRAGNILDYVFTFGKEAAHITNYLNENSNIKSTHFDTKDELVKTLKDTLQEGDWVLVKGSRGMAMDQVVTMLEKE